jgi:hypothetical protein
MKTKTYHPNAFSNRSFLISASILVAGTIVAAFASSGFSSSAAGRLGGNL